MASACPRPKKRVGAYTGMTSALKPGSLVYSCAIFLRRLQGLRRNRKRDQGRRSSAESLGGASPGLGGFFFPILRRRVGVERMEKTRRDGGDFIDRGEERSFVCFRRLVETCDFSHELKRSRPNLLVGNGRIEVEEGFDIPAHTVRPPSAMANRPEHFLMGGAFTSSRLCHPERSEGSAVCREMQISRLARDDKARFSNLCTMVHWYHDSRIATPHRASPDRRSHGETPPQSSQGLRRISRPVARRPARRHRAPRLRRQDSLQRRIAQTHSRPEKVLRPRPRFQRQPPPQGDQAALGRQDCFGEENPGEEKMTPEQVNNARMNHSRFPTAL